MKANCTTFHNSCLNTYAFSIWAFFLFFSHSSDALSEQDAMSWIINKNYSSIFNAAWNSLSLIGFWVTSFLPSTRLNKELNKKSKELNCKLTPICEIDILKGTFTRFLEPAGFASYVCYKCSCYACSLHTSITNVWIFSRWNLSLSSRIACGYCTCENNSSINAQ